MNFSDLAFLALKGVLVASIPLVFVWVAKGNGAHGGDRFRRLAWVTAFFTFDLIVFGAFTRLTDSGLGCPDWPGCYAKANPLEASSEIGAAQAAMPTGPVTMTKAWIEMVHRYLAMAVGVLIVVMLAVAWLRYLRAKRSPARASAHVANSRARRPWLPTVLLALVCLQGAFGAWTVTLKLQPIIVTTHLLLAMLLLALLVWHAASLDHASATWVPERSLTRLAIVGVAVLATQIALGGWVSTNYAVLACRDFPLCQGQLVPEMDFAQGFQLWRELGKNADGSYLPFPALTAIHWAHRAFAWVVFAVLGSLAWLAHRAPQLRGYAKALALLLAAQFATGVVNVVLAWPLAAAVLHNAGAAGLIIVMVLINYRIHRIPIAAPGAHRLSSNPATAHATGS